MATKRYISTSFWDDEWVHNLDPSEKLLYLYFMTNTLTNIAGVYKIATDRVSYDTGFNKKTIENIMNKFFEIGKLIYTKGYVIIPSWPRHQNWETKTQIKKGIDLILNSLPQNILDEMSKYKYDYAHDRLPIDYDRLPIGYDRLPIDYDSNQVEPSYLYSDLDLYLNSDIDVSQDKNKIEQFEDPPIQETKKTKQDHKNSYGRYSHVMLSESEYSSLVGEFGEPAIVEYIRRQDVYVEREKRKPYIMCAAIIVDWIEKDKSRNEYKFQLSNNPIDQRCCPNVDCGQPVYGSLSFCTSCGTDMNPKEKI